MLRIDTAKELAFEESEADGVVGLPASRLPGGFLSSQYDRQPIQVRHHALVDRLTEREQAGLMSQQLPDRHVVLALLGELRPVRAHPLFVIEPAARVGHRHGHGRQALGRREHQDHGVLFPRLAGRLVPNPAPQVDHLLAVAVDAAGRPQLTPAGEVVGKGLAHRLETGARTTRGWRPRLIADHLLHAASTPGLAGEWRPAPRPRAGTRRC